MIQEVRDKLEWMFSDLVFDEPRHLYFVNGVGLPSVSGLIKKHETFVDFEEKARNQAERFGVPLEVIKKKWNTKKEAACALGTATHLYAENYDGTQEPSNLLENSAKKFLEELPEYYEIVCKELRMYSREFKYAGTSDLVLLDKRTNTLVIADYKTNEDLFKTYQNLQAPFETYAQNNYNKYQLQLSYYQIMLEQTGYEVSNRVIIWLKRDGTYEIYCTEDLTVPIRAFLCKKI
jgi:hypothetical protein